MEPTNRSHPIAHCGVSIFWSPVHRTPWLTHIYAASAFLCGMCHVTSVYIYTYMARGAHTVHIHAYCMCRVAHTSGCVYIHIYCVFTLHAARDVRTVYIHASTQYTKRIHHAQCSVWTQYMCMYTHPDVCATRHTQYACMCTVCAPHAMCAYRCTSCMHAPHPWRTQCIHTCINAICIYTLSERVCVYTYTNICMHV